MSKSPNLRPHEILRGTMIGIGIKIMHKSVTRFSTRTVIRKAGLCGMQYPE
jgi:hypothetical protein